MTKFVRFLNLAGYVLNLDPKTKQIFHYEYIIQLA